MLVQLKPLHPLRLFVYVFPSKHHPQYKLWQKERGPLLTGFPLWSRDELA